MAVAPAVMIGASVLGGVTQAAQSIYQVDAARKNADAMEKYNKQYNAQLTEQMVENYGQLSEVELDQQQQALDDTLAAQKEYIQAKGRINTMAAWSGSSGASLSSQLVDLSRNKFSNYSAIQGDMQARMDDIADQAQGLRYQTRSGYQPEKLSRPSWLSAIGGVVSGTAKAVSGITGMPVSSG